MVRKPAMEPMSEEEFVELEAQMDDQAEQLREALAEDLGGKPEDYRFEGGDHD